MALINFEDFKKSPDYENFITENNSNGTLKVQAFTAEQAIPIVGAEILITKEIGDNTVLFFRGFTDESGIIDDIELPAPATNYQENIFEVPPYTTYNLTAIQQNFNSIKKYNLGILSNIKALQYVKMMPDITLTEGGLNES